MIVMTGKIHKRKSMTNLDTVSLLAELFTTPSLRVAVTPRLRGRTSAQLFELEKVASELLDQLLPDHSDSHKQIEALMYLVSNLFGVLDIPLTRLNQEVAAILTGTIDASEFSLAAKLDITNAQVRKWRLEGEIYVKQQLIKQMIQYFK